MVLYFAATIERFESLKGLGLEAKLIKLDLKIDEATILLNQIKMVGEITGKASLSMYAQAGRIAGPPAHTEMYDLLRKVHDSLSSMGSSQETIQSAMDPCIRVMQLDFCRAITKLATERIRKQMTALDEKRRGCDAERSALISLEIEHLEDVRTKILRGHGIEDSSFPAELAKLLRDPAIIGLVEAQEAAAELDRFTPMIQRFRSKGILTDPDEWFSRAKEAYT